MKIFDKICIIFINPLVWIITFLLIAFIFKLWGCIFLLVLFFLIKRANVQKF